MAEPTTPHRLDSMQALRAFAALGVVTLHMSEAAAQVSGWNARGFGTWGAAGVDVFFVISGFIIATTLQRKPTPTEFLRRRWWRIAPLYFLLSISGLLLLGARGGLTIGGLVATFAFWPALNEMSTPLLTVGWTLCFEMLFYVATSFALTRWRWRYVALGLGFVSCVALSRTGWPPFQFLGNPMILEFLGGMALVRWRPRLSPTFAWASIATGLAGLLLFTTDSITDPLATLIGSVAWSRSIMLGLPSILIVYGFAELEGLRWPRWLVGVGNASYSLYLSHLFVAGLAGGMASILGGPAAAAFGTAAALGFAILVYRRLELPLNGVPQLIHGLRRRQSMAAG